MEAILFANHCDEKLSNYIGKIPTSMANINGKPLINYVISHLVKNGFKNVIIIVGEMHDVVEDYIGYEFHGMTIDYSRIKKNVTIVSALRKAAQGIKSDEVFLIDGRSFFQISHGQLIENMLHHQANMILALKESVVKENEYAVRINNTFQVQSISSDKSSKENLIFGGTCAVQRAFLEKSTSQLATLFEGGLTELPVAAMHSYAMPLDNFYIHLATTNDYLKAHEEFRNHKIR